jgi:C1A family cysteine protease
MKTFAATLAAAGTLGAIAYVSQSPEAGSFLKATVISEQEHAFMEFINQYRRYYGTKEEYEYRLELFTETYNFVKAHNAGNSSYKVGINKFADYSSYEKEQLNGFIPTAESVEGENDDCNEPAEIFESINWVSKGAVTPVKDQGSCGSCWTFSTTGSVESATFVATGTLPSLAEQ